ncbi:hypothetical protein KIV56_17055 [Cryobacterium breve]|uniref:Uncharacterized protein n=1 Tax=Cryobacterium breve TaxID=1259258 RepID=A0ABY7NC65_9MICO|nr:hypothetical protein [Cryobacterium breve]WBM79855.1 hypothetical protein KIV56_17055 [Cryobacterium breve]
MSAQDTPGFIQPDFTLANQLLGILANVISNFWATLPAGTKVFLILVVVCAIVFGGWRLDFFGSPRTFGTVVVVLAAFLVLISIFDFWWVSRVILSLAVAVLMFRLVIAISRRDVETWAVVTLTIAAVLSALVSAHFSWPYVLSEWIWTFAPIVGVAAIVGGIAGPIDARRRAEEARQILVRQHEEHIERSERLARQKAAAAEARWSADERERERVQQLAEEQERQRQADADKMSLEMQRANARGREQQEERARSEAERIESLRRLRIRQDEQEALDAARKPNPTSAELSARLASTLGALFGGVHGQVDLSLSLRDLAELTGVDSGKLLNDALALRDLNQVEVNRDIQRASWEDVTIKLTQEGARVAHERNNQAPRFVIKKASGLIGVNNVNGGSIATGKNGVASSNNLNFAEMSVQEATTVLAEAARAMKLHTSQSTQDAIEADVVVLEKADDAPARRVALKRLRRTAVTVGSAGVQFLEIANGLKALFGW